MRTVGLVVIAMLGVACSKNNADVGPAPATGGTTGAPGTGERIAVPGATGGMVGGAPEGASKGGPDTSFQLAVQPPSAGKAGAESVARVVVTPGSGWKMNLEYPTKLKLAPPEGVTVTKPVLEVADAKIDEKQLAFDVKLTPVKAGTYKVGGEIKFAVCTPETCDPKKQEIAIEVVAQ